MRRVFEQIDVETDKRGRPEQLIWRSRTYAVSGVLDHWRYCGKWWLGDWGQQRRYYRLHVSPLVASQSTYGHRVLEVFRQGDDWTLSHFCD